MTNRIIEKVSEFTEWCASMVVAPKKKGKPQIGVDLKKLNKAVKRERFVLPTAEEGITVYRDNIIMPGRDMAQQCLHRVLDQLRSAGLNLNEEKYMLREKTTFPGIDAECVRPDPAKVSAISEHPLPENI